PIMVGNLLRQGECYFQLGEPEKGISQWRQLIDRYPDSYQTMTSLWNLARYYTKNNNDSEALEAYRELSERFSKSRLGDDALYWRGNSSSNSKYSLRITLQSQGKTGTLSSTSGLAGLLETKNKRWVVFCLMENNFIAEENDPKIFENRIIEYIYENL
ncbi:unnamed protein product, partial [marine sediment metagenome]